LHQTLSTRWRKDEMKILYRCCCGIDVHKKLLVACLLVAATEHEPERKEIRQFGSTWQELLSLVQWLRDAGCTHIAMESTGVYWRPVFNALEESFEGVMIINAQHIKAVPGRKTDVKDAQWIAELLQHGLLRASFIPPRPQRDLRDLTRGRKQLVEERTRIVNRVHKTLEDTNIKLASVVSDLMGKSARQMLAALLDGRDVREIAQMGRGALREKQAQLEQALQGDLREHHRFLLQQHLKHIEALEEQIADFDREIVQRIGQEPPPDAPIPPSAESQERQEPSADAPQPDGEQDDPLNRLQAQEAAPQPEREGKVLCAPGYEGFAQVVQRLDAITGISLRLAHVLVAEIGIDMQRFASAEHLASWVGIAPGNKISAGKRLGGKTTKGNTYARTGLIEAAHSAALSKGTFLGALYRRLKPRLGHKRAIMAVAHRILIILYAMLKKEEQYQEYGEQIVEERLQEARKQRAVRELEKQGFTVILQEVASA
jgi:transposase